MPLRIFVWAVLMTITISGFCNSDWELKKDKHNIQVYTHKSDRSAFLAFRGVTVVNADIGFLIDLLKDVKHFDGWLHGCYEPEIVEKIDDNTTVARLKFSTPAPFFADRDLVEILQMQTKSDTEIMFELTGVPERISPEKGIVRMPYFKGHWRFTKIDNEHAQIEYEGLVDPGGHIPATIANLVIVDMPYQSLSNIRELADTHSKLGKSTSH